MTRRGFLRALGLAPAAAVATVGGGGDPSLDRDIATLRKGLRRGEITSRIMDDVQREGWPSHHFIREVQRRADEAMGLAPRPGVGVGLAPTVGVELADKLGELSPGEVPIGGVEKLGADDGVHVVRGQAAALFQHGDQVFQQPALSDDLRLEQVGDLGISHDGPSFGCGCDSHLDFTTDAAVVSAGGGDVARDPLDPFSGGDLRRSEAPEGAALLGVSSLTSGRANAAGFSFPERAGVQP